MRKRIKYRKFGYCVEEMENELPDYYDVFRFFDMCKSEQAYELRNNINPLIIGYVNGFKKNQKTN